MDMVTDIISGNPLSTPIGIMIENATDATLASENWSLIMAVCDEVGAAEPRDGQAARDAWRAIRRRLHQTAGKQHVAFNYTLTVLEACMKNCGHKFHVLVCQKDSVQDLIKLIGPKYDPPLVLQQRLLALVRCWAETFSQQPDLAGVVAVYDEMSARGIPFPPAGDTQTMQQLYTVAPSARQQSARAAVAAGGGGGGGDDSIDGSATTSTAAAGLHSHHQQHLMTSPYVNTTSTPAAAAAGGAGTTATATVINSSSSPLSARPEDVQQQQEEQSERLTRELHVVAENSVVLAEMLTALRPATATGDDLHLMKRLVVTCREMHARLVALVSHVTNHLLLAEILRIIDELNNSFIRYERFERATGRSDGPQQQQQQQDQEQKQQQQQRQQKQELCLLDMNDDTALSRQTGQLSLQPTPVSQSSVLPNLNTDGDSAKVVPSRNSPPIQDRPCEFDEMEQWLKQEADDVDSSTMTSSEFDRFLAARASDTKTNK